MANGTDPIKHGDQDLRVQAVAYKNAITTNPADWGLSADDLAAFSAAFALYATNLNSHIVAQDGARSATTSKDAAKEALISVFRSQYRRVKADPEVTDAMLETAQLPPRDDSRSPVPPPTMVPAALLEKSDRLVQTIRIIDSANPSRRGKPNGVAGFRIFYKVGPVQPTSTRDCVFAGQFGKTRVNIAFDPADGGKQVWYIVVAVNARGEQGPMSEVMEATIAA